MSFLDNPIPVIELQNGLATSGVYAIWCQPTDTYYIGQSTIVARRITDHFVALASKTHGNQALQKDYNDHGEAAFSVQLLHDMPDAEVINLRQWETKEILRFRNYSQKLYNKVGFTVSAPKSHLSLNELEEAAARLKAVAKASGATRNENAAFPRQSLKDLEIEDTPAACESCGKVGHLHQDIFECDDHALRCYKCTDRYLSAWTFKPTETKSRRRAANWFFRWQAQGKMRRHEFLMAAKRYAERNGHLPTRAWVNHNCDCEIKIGGLLIEKRKETPIGYLDLAK